MKEKGVTQSDLAEHFEMTPAGMQKWLSGAREPSVAELLEIADFLKVPRAQLLLGSEPADDIGDLPDYARSTLRRIVEGARNGDLDADWFKRLNLALEALDGPSSHIRPLDFRSAALGLATALDLQEHQAVYAVFVRKVDEIVSENDQSKQGAPSRARALDS